MVAIHWNDCLNYCLCIGIIDIQKYKVQSLVELDVFLWLQIFHGEVRR